MKLSKYMKEAIVRRIVADIPQRDFQAEAEALVLPAAISRLPIAVRAVYENSETAPYVKTARLDINCGALYVQVPWVGGYMDSEDKVEAIGAEAWQAFQELCAENRAARDAKRALENQLEANFRSISTRKQFVERYPELAKYAPEERELPANLPATTALIDTLKAAGLQVEPVAA